MFELLKNSGNVVYGLSRTNSIQADAFKYIYIDLSDIDTVKSFQFPELTEIDQLVLINNAGVIGEISSVGNKSGDGIINTFNVNTLAPSLLMNQFVKQYQSLKVNKTIVNISSGAGRHSISSWADYCASKSALDMFSLVAADEQKQHQNPIRIISIAPGVLDTQMQKDIRMASKKDFPQLDYFLQLKNKELLDSTKDVALKLISLIEDVDDEADVLMDIRDF